MTAYVTRTDITVAIFRADEYLAWSQKYSDTSKAIKGFQRRTVANALGYPAQYSIFNRWESRAAARDGINGPEMQAFVKANPADGVFSLMRPVMAYEIVVAVADPPRVGGYTWLSEWTIDDGKATAFEQSRQEMFEVGVKIGNGFVGGRLLRFLGGGDRYLLGWQYNSWEEVRAVSAMPEVRAWFDAHPRANYASAAPVGQAFEVVQAT